MVILALLGNISQETSPRAEGTARLSRYWIKREQAVLAQEASPRKTENNCFILSRWNLPTGLFIDTNRPVASNITTGMTPMRRTAPPSPKTMQIEMMEEEREEQQRALEQIEDSCMETRLW